MTFTIGVSQGQVNTLDDGVKFGYNPAVTAAEDIWEGGGLYTGQPLTASGTVNIVSASTDDAAAGDGAQTVEIHGLDANFDPESETITLNGATSAVSQNSYRRVFRMIVLTAGSSGHNTGTLITRLTTSTAVQFGVMIAEANQSNIAALTVPDGKTLNATQLHVTFVRSAAAAGSALYSFRTREPGGVYRGQRFETVTSSFPVSEAPNPPLTFPSRTDIKFRIESVSASGVASARLAYYLT